MQENDTIYALSSGAGLSGIAVVRVSGPESATLVKALCGELPPPRTASLKRIRSRFTRELIDEGLVLWFPAPNSFTGEDLAEFHVHGGQAILRALFNEFSRSEGLRPADAGEFTRRAFRGGKMDLVEAEGLSDLIQARSERQRRQALFHMGGKASALVREWQQELIGILAHMEATIDFVDEADVMAQTRAIVWRGIEDLINAIDTELGRAAQSERLREGLRVVLTGPPNVGKSSLLNKLAGKNAAIVSPQPGTTRDVVEVHLVINGIPVQLQDTAGIRQESSDPVEIMGIDRAWKAQSESNLTIWLSSPDIPESHIPPPFDSDTLWVWNKADLGSSPEHMAKKPFLEISTVTGGGLGHLELEIGKRLEEQITGAEDAIIMRERHRDCITTARDHLLRALLGNDSEFEIAAEEIRLASRALARLTGTVDVERVLDEIFRKFCIGK